MVNLAAIQVGNVRYNSPTVQVTLLAFVVFCTVGMFSAISNLGAGGTQDIALSDTANGVLYGCFAIAGLFGGAFTNRFGVRVTLFVGSLGYALYIGGLWCHQTTGNRWFLILSGAILGVCAALLWSAQGCLIMSLPMEKDKGRSFSLFWIIFQSGALMGGLIVLGITVRQGQVAALGTGIYLAFIIIMFIGSALTWTILPPSKVIRNDGSIVKLQKAATIREEVTGLWIAMKNPCILLLLPAFFASNYFYAYQGAINTWAFDGRTRALVAVLSGAGSMLGSAVMGFICDKSPFKSRRGRAFFALGCMTVATFAIWGAGLAWQLTFTRATPKPNLDWVDKAAGEPLALLAFYYFADGAYQTLIYYMMGCLSNDPWELARYSGLYKAVQSAGAAGSFGMDAVATPYLNELLASALLTLVSLPLMGMVVQRIRETNTDLDVKVDDIGALDADVAVPVGHHLGHVSSEKSEDGEKNSKAFDI